MQYYCLRALYATACFVEKAVYRCLLYLSKQIQLYMNAGNFIGPRGVRITKVLLYYMYIITCTGVYELTR